MKIWGQELVSKQFTGMCLNFSSSFSPHPQIKGSHYLKILQLIGQTRDARSVARSCPALCDPMDCRPDGAFVHGFSGQEYWSGLPFPAPGGLPDPGIEPESLAW